VSKLVQCPTFDLFFLRLPGQPGKALGFSSD